MDPSPAALSVKSLCGKSKHGVPGKFRDPDPCLRMSNPFNGVTIACLDVPSLSSHKFKCFSTSVHAEEQMTKYLSPLNPRQKFLFPAGCRNEQICCCSIWRYLWLLFLTGKENLRAWVLWCMWRMWVLYKWRYEHENFSQTVISIWVHITRFL